MSQTARLQRLRTRLAVAWFLLSAVALVWPVFHWAGNYARPFVLGIPWSLAYVLAVVMVNFGVLMALYRAGWIDASEPEEARDR